MDENKKRPTVAIIGRPNVGKSSLFNKIAGRKISIVKDTPGVTRDRIYSEIEWTGKKFILIDTGGLELNSQEFIIKSVFEQAKIAIESCDLVLFVVDGREGLINLDLEIANYLRLNFKTKKILLVVNKIDNFSRDKNLIYEFYKLGFGEPIAISAENNSGLGDLLEEIINNLDFVNDFDDEKENVIKVAIVGKPNVGKSSIVNKILGENRSIVNNISGTTRDAIDSFFKYDGQEYIFIDTAGIRKKSKVKQDLEYYSVIRAIDSIERADICLLIIDAEENICEQDTKIAGIAHDNFKPVIVVVNKWDKIEKNDKTVNIFLDKINNKLSYMSYAQKIFVSALTGQRLNKIFDLIKMVWENNNLRIKTGILNEVLVESVAMNPPKIGKGKQLKIYYATQINVCPPTFKLFVNDLELMHFSYKRYLENQIRKAFGCVGVPIKFVIKSKVD